jgi:hypothetical protein
LGHESAKCPAFHKLRTWFDSHRPLHNSCSCSWPYRLWVEHRTARAACCYATRCKVKEFGFAWKVCVS